MSITLSEIEAKLQAKIPADYYTYPPAIQLLYLTFISELSPLQCKALMCTYRNLQSSASLIQCNLFTGWIKVRIEKTHGIKLSKKFNELPIYWKVAVNDALTNMTDVEIAKYNSDFATQKDTMNLEQYFNLQHYC